MLLDDGTFIYDSKTARDFLTSVGVQNIEDFLSIIWNTQELEEELRYSQQQIIDYENIIDGLDYDIRSFINDLEDLCDKLASGTGGTKKQYAERIMRLVDSSFSY